MRWWRQGRRRRLHFLASSPCRLCVRRRWSIRWWAGCRASSRPSAPRNPPLQRTIALSPPSPLLSPPLACPEPPVAPPPCALLASHRGGCRGREKLPASFLESALPTKTEFEASLLLPDIERAKLERDTKAAAETIKAVTLAKAEAAGARAGEAAAATAMQAAVRGHGARSSMAAAADAETESYINEVVAGVVASAIDTVSEAEKAAAKAPKPNLLTRLSTMSSSLFAKKTKKAAEGEAEVEVETDKRKSFSPFKKSKKATADVEEQQPVIKFGFKVSESGEVTIDMELEKAARAVA